MPRHATLLATLAASILSTTALAQQTQPATTTPAAAPATNTSPVLDRALAFLRAQQDPATGGWSVNPKGPNFPAITGLVLISLADNAKSQGKNPIDDPAVASGLKLILANVRPDGGIYDTILPSYNTSICLEALVAIGSPQALAAIKPAQEFLKSLQWGEGAVERPALDETAKIVDSTHAFYGGWGYGRHGRPDLSNTAWAIEGLRKSGLPESDPAFQRALIFLKRVQMDARFNDAPYAAGSTQGGFIYATSENKDKIGSGQSNAGEIEETLSDGSKASRLRAYGSMTYSGFKSLIYAGLNKNEPRVQAALGWLQRNYTLAENPGLGNDGMYYYYVVMARALAATQSPTIEVLNPDGSPLSPQKLANWSQDLHQRLAQLQAPDGSFTSVDNRWMEDNTVLITAYGALALTSASQK